MKRSKRGVAAAVICAVVWGPATVNAATVTPQSGTVLINKGDGFSPITADAELKPGTRVMVQPGGLASIVYANNCTVRVGSGIWLVQAGAPCPVGTTEIDFTARMNQETEPPPAPGIPPLVIGGVIVAVGVGLGVFVSQNNNNNSVKPASP